LLKQCKSFIDYKKGDVEFVKLLNTNPKIKTRHINEKSRLKILKRDNYSYVKCGRSPATHKGIVLHIDHIKPFSKCGDSRFDNLQTLCNKCNLGKGNDETV
jgi:5-methylcytosine-specific restriction endonuclease McrA